MLTKLILLRHGQTELKQSLIGTTDVGLSELGQQQIQRALSAITEVDLVISSPMRRCVDSAKTWAAMVNKPFAIEGDWCEMDFGDWDGLTFNELYQPNSDFSRFSQDPTSVTPPNGESVAAFKQRVLAALDSWLIETQGQTCLVLTHGGVIRTLINWALGFPEPGGIPVARLAIEHASQTVISVYSEPQGSKTQNWPRLELLNYCSYPASLGSQQVEEKR